MPLEKAVHYLLDLIRASWHIADDYREFIVAVGVDIVDAYLRLNFPPSNLIAHLWRLFVVHVLVQ